MLKKLLSLSLVAVMLFTVAFAAPGGVMLMEPTYAAESDAIVIEANAAEITDSGLTGTVSLNLTSTVDRDSAVLITAVYDTNGTMLAASLSDEVTSVSADDNKTTVTLPNVKTTANDKYVIKFFWWDSKDTLIPVVENAITVAPQPAVWSGTADVAEEPELVDGYYQIENGEDLAWFANKVNNDVETTYNAKLVNDIYLNNFIDNNGNFDEDWYEDADNVAVANSWNSYSNADETSFCISSFAGEFDGNNKTIYGLYMRGATGVGFFSSVAGGTVKNVTFKGSYLVSTTLTKTTTGYWNSSAGAKAIAIVAALATTANTTSKFEKITVGGKITAAETVDTTQYDVLTAAAIVGRITSNVNISDCNSYVDIIDSAKSFPTSASATGSTVDVAKCGTGGIVGYLGSTGSSKVSGNTITITNCVNYGNIVIPYAPKSVGGIVGHCREGALTFVNCGNAGKIRATTISTTIAEMYGKHTKSYGATISGETESETFASVGSAAKYDATEVID